MIEHLSPTEFEKAIREWYRVLKWGGKLIIRCPNFELYLREWLNENYSERWGWGIVNIFGHPDRGEGCLTRNGFTPRRLVALLSSVGFKTLKCEVCETRPEYKDTPENTERMEIYFT
jgi:predicted SAM-dependent methyltransferase